MQNKKRKEEEEGGREISPRERPQNEGLHSTLQLVPGTDKIQKKAWQVLRISLDGFL